MGDDGDKVGMMRISTGDFEKSLSEPSEQRELYQRTLYSWFGERMHTCARANNESGKPCIPH